MGKDYNSIGLIMPDLRRGLGARKVGRRTGAQVALWARRYCFLRTLLMERRAVAMVDSSLQNPQERTGVDEVSALVSAIIQAGQLGVRILQALCVRLEPPRQRRRKRVEEHVNKALVMFIVLAINVVMIGPVILQMRESC